MGVGKMTKKLTALAAADKEYEAAIAFGAATDTLDATGKIVAQKAVFPADADAVSAAIESFVSRPYAQVPPAHSAIKVGGKRAYDLARGGRDFSLPARNVSLFRAELLSYAAPVATVRLAVSKGFYVRAFARDLAARLGTVGTALAIVRTRCGPHALGDALTLADLVRGNARAA